MKRLLVSVLAGGVLMSAELPVKTVILYKNGVGYFERSGELRAGETARLDFKASDMNDVLKSLTLEDKSGGKVAGVRYDAFEPLEKRLEEYPFQVLPRTAVSAFLDQLKGARLELKTGSGETVGGVIFSARAVVSGDKTMEKEQVTLLLDSGAMRTYELAAVMEMKFPDAGLQRQLKDYLAALSVARSKEKRSVYVDSTDARVRQIVASYMIPSPVWKSSYRLILKDSEPVLEGWAIVDNTTGEDWTNVTLSLVSGRPVSFLSKLYEPKYKTRPEAELPEDAAVGPQVFAGAVQESAGPAMAMRARKAAAPPPPPPAPMMEAMALRADAASSVAVNTEGRELGDLFEYRFGGGVTVRKSESAMLPFLQQKMQARKLLIYSDRSLQNPMNAAEITNTSGKTLDGGPITVFDGGAYAGEALVETFKAGDKRLISYGVDLGTRVTTAFDSARDAIREIKASRGVLTTKLAVQETQTYTIRNVDAKAKTLIIEHPVRPGYKFLNVKPVESTATMHRFEVKLGASATEKFVVTEENVVDQQVMISSLVVEQLLVYAQNRTLSAEGKRQLEAIVAARRGLADIDRQVAAQEREINELVKDQERIRQNLTSLNQVTGQQEQVNRYARELADQEGRLAGMRDKVSGLKKQKAAQEQQLSALLEKVTF